MVDSGLEDLRARLTDVDDRLALKIAEKDEAAAKVEALKQELRNLNQERDPLANQVAELERNERAEAGVPITAIGDGENG